MSFSATVSVTGAARGNYDTPFLNLEAVVVSDSVGGIYDEMVEASYVLAKETQAYIESHFPEDYDMGKDYWYVTVSHPDVMNPYNSEATHGAGSTLRTTQSIIESVVHYRHLEIVNFYRNTKLLRDLDKLGGLLANTSLVPTITKDREFMNILKEEDISAFRNYGYTGADLNETVKNLGEDLYFTILKKAHAYRTVRITDANKLKLPNRNKVEKPIKEVSFGSKILNLIGIK